MSFCRFDLCWREAVTHSGLCREHRTIPGVAHKNDERLCPPQKQNVCILLINQRTGSGASLEYTPSVKGGR